MDTKEVIGKPDTTVVVLEKEDYGNYVAIFGYRGVLTFDKVELTSLVERLTKALDQM